MSKKPGELKEISRKLFSHLQEEGVTSDEEILTVLTIAVAGACSGIAHSHDKDVYELFESFCGGTRGMISLMNGDSSDEEDKFKR